MDSYSYNTRWDGFYFTVIGLLAIWIVSANWKLNDKGLQQQDAEASLLGTIVAIGKPQAADGWLLCNGDEVPGQRYPKVAAVLGTTWSSASEGNFRLPDLWGRTAIGTGRGNNLSDRAIGSSGGEEQTLLTEDHLPSHSHPIIDSGHIHEQMALAFSFEPGTSGAVQPTRHLYRVSGEQQLKTGNREWAGEYQMGLATESNKSNITIQTTGKDQPHNNMTPFVVVNYIIKH
jgi:microcystin-dependent protein